MDADRPARVPGDPARSRNGDLLPSLSLEPLLGANLMSPTYVPRGVGPTTPEWRQYQAARIRAYRAVHLTEMRAYDHRRLMIPKVRGQMLARSVARNSTRPTGHMSSLLARLGYVEDDKHLLWELQGERCAVDWKPLRWQDAQLDHSHQTKVLRGVVCEPHNLALGSAEKNGSRKQVLQVYLDRGGVPCRPV